MKVEDTVSRSKQEKSKNLLFDALKNKTSYYLNKPALEDTDLYYYVKDFFREYLDLNRETSFEEIMQEIDKIYIQKDVKDAIKAYLKKISEIEYKDSTFDEDKIKQLIQEFYELTKHMQFEEKQETKPFIKFLTQIGLYKKPKISLQKQPHRDVTTQETTQEQTHTTQEQNPQEQLRPLHEMQSQETTQEQTTNTENIDANTPLPEQEQQDTTQLQSQSSNMSEPPSFDEEKDLDLNDEHKGEKVQKYLKDVPLSNDFAEEIDLSQGKQESRWTEDTHELNDDANKKTNTSSKTKPKSATDEKLNINDLISKANKTTKQNELVQLYKEINKLYEKETVENRAKIYPDLMKLYKKVAKKK